jgi:replicative DNA helicase
MPTSHTSLKIPPHSLEAEQSVLGGLLLDNQGWDKMADVLQPKDFYRFEHQLIFQAILELVNKHQPFDILTVSEQLKFNKAWIETEGEIYLFELARNTPSAANVLAYAEIVKEHSILRQLIHAASEVTERALSPAGRPVSDILDEAERCIFQIAERDARGTAPQAVSGLVAKAMDRIHSLMHSKQAVTGVSTAYRDLDEMTSGLQASDLIVIAGRPAMGKTSLAMNIAEHAAIRGDKPVLVFSMEMPGEMLAMRLISSLGRINHHQIRTGKLTDEDWPRIGSAVSILSSAKLFIDDTPALSPSDIRARSRRLARAEGPLGLIIIDYLQLMQMPGFQENRALEISEISRAMKALAKELQVPVIALSQLNRGLEQRSDKRPIMSDLRDSGAIEQDADLILFIYRDEVYNEASLDKGIAEIIIAKQRNGPIGKVRLTFFGKYTRFENFTTERYES